MIGEPPARGDHEPALRVFRHAGRRPALQRGGERVGQRILRRRDVAVACGEEGDELAVAFARDAGRGGADGLVAGHRVHIA